MSWSSTYGTANVSLKAFFRGGLQTLCTAQQRSCNVTGLSCGESYNLSLTASNEQCSLTAPTHISLTTRSFQQIFICSIVQSVRPQAESFPLKHLTQVPALLRVWMSACSVALAQLTCPGRSNLMLHCIQQVQSKLREETRQSATLQGPAVSFLV